jgi:hypothetical protein
MDHDFVIFLEAVTFLWLCIIFPCMLLSRINKILEANEHRNTQLDSIAHNLSLQTELAGHVARNTSPLRIAEQTTHEEEAPAIIDQTAEG